MVGIPKYLVVMEISSWVEPQEEPLLPVSMTVNEDIGLESDRLPFSVAQELEVELVVVARVRRR